jgi:hypothetical protein
MTWLCYDWAVLDIGETVIAILAGVRNLFHLQKPSPPSIQHSVGCGRALSLGMQLLGHEAEPTPSNAKVKSE